MSDTSHNIRCPWCGDDPVYVKYHDEEWGVPQHDDQKLFEKIVLEGAQAGLSWITILRRRENYRRAFGKFDIEKVAAFTARDVERLVNDAGIIRNRLKIESAISNARATLKVQERYGSLDAFLWQFVDGRPIQNAWDHWKQIPATTPESDAMSKALKREGFKFVGSTICYALMQSCGLVNDHAIDCFRYNEVKKL